MAINSVCACGNYFTNPVAWSTPKNVQMTKVQDMDCDKDYDFDKDMDCDYDFDYDKDLDCDFDFDTDLDCDYDLDAPFNMIA